MVPPRAPVIPSWRDTPFAPPANTTPMDLRDLRRAAATILAPPDDEGGSDYDGVLSHEGEWHAFALGLYRGAGARPRLGGPKAEAEREAEPWYYVAGWAAGSALSAAARLRRNGG